MTAAALPMFPLGTVLLPHNPLPLHVFEPRYQVLIERVIAGDGRFGVTLIERGSEVGGGDVRTDVGCVAVVREAQPLGDGRWAVLAEGIERVVVREWLPDDPHPWAMVEPWPEVDDGPMAVDDVRQLLRRSLALLAELGESAAPATVDLDLPDPVVVDLAAGLAPIAVLDRQRLLACAGRGERARQLCVMLADSIELLEARLSER